MELRDTALMMASADYKERFKAEYYQVKIRLEKLNAMVNKWDEGKLEFKPTCPREIYTEQIAVMVTCPAERTELLQEYTEKMKVIEEFAPKLITDKFELKSMIGSLLESAGIEPLKKNKGQIMKTVMPELKGKADMKIANKVIEGMLK